MPPMIFYDLESGGEAPAAPYTAAIGNFDGVHTAHRLLLSEACSLAEKTKTLPAAFSFEGLPTPGLLCSPERKAELFADAGIKCSVLCDFRRVRNMEPESFVSEVLVPSGCRALVCGFNFRFGRNACAPAAELVALCAEYGISVTVMPPVRMNGEVVSSSLIRSALSSGDIERANALLGRPFEIEGEISAGMKLGRQLGFPTINQILPEGFICPAHGVYLTECRIDRIVYNAVTNIGRRPTIGGETISIESHLLDAKGDFYGKNCRTSLLLRLRGEICFPSFEELSEQIARDVGEAKELFANGIF